MRINEVRLKKIASVSTTSTSPSSLVSSSSSTASKQCFSPSQNYHSQRAYLSSYYESVRQDESWKRYKQKLDDEEAAVFTSWLNAQFSQILQNREPGLEGENARLLEWLRVSNLVNDLRDGLRVIYLLDLIYGVCLTKEFGDRKLGCLQLHKIKNHETCLKYLRRAREIKCVGINALDLAGGNLKMLIGLLFLIKHDANQSSVGYEHRSFTINNHNETKVLLSNKLTCQSAANSSINNKSESSEIFNLSKSENKEKKNKVDVKIVKLNCSEMNEMSEKALAEMDSDYESIAQSQVVLDGVKADKSGGLLFNGMEDSGYTSEGRRNNEDSASHEESASKDDESELASTLDFTDDMKKSLDSDDEESEASSKENDLFCGAVGEISLDSLQKEFKFKCAEEKRHVEESGRIRMTQFAQIVESFMKREANETENSAVNAQSTLSLVVGREEETEAKQIVEASQEFIFNIQETNVDKKIKHENEKNIETEKLTVEKVMSELCEKITQLIDGENCEAKEETKSIEITNTDAKLAPIKNDLNILNECGVKEDVKGDSVEPVILDMIEQIEDSFEIINVEMDLSLADSSEEENNQVNREVFCAIEKFDCDEELKIEKCLKEENTNLPSTQSDGSKNDDECSEIFKLVEEMADSVISQIENLASEIENNRNDEKFNQECVESEHLQPEKKANQVEANLEACIKDLLPVVVNEKSLDQTEKIDVLLADEKSAETIKIEELPIVNDEVKVLESISVNIETYLKNIETNIVEIKTCLDQTEKTDVLPVVEEVNEKSLENEPNEMKELSIANDEVEVKNETQLENKTAENVEFKIEECSINGENCCNEEAKEIQPTIEEASLLESTETKTENAIHEVMITESQEEPESESITNVTCLQNKPNEIKEAKEIEVKEFESVEVNVETCPENIETKIEATKDSENAQTEVLPNLVDEVNVKNVSEDGETCINENTVFKNEDLPVETLPVETCLDQTEKTDVLQIVEEVKVNEKSLENEPNEINESETIKMKVSKESKEAEIEKSLEEIETKNLPVVIDEETEQEAESLQIVNQTSILEIKETETAENQVLPGVNLESWPVDSETCLENENTEAVSKNVGQFKMANNVDLAEESDEVFAGAQTASDEKFEDTFKIIETNVENLLSKDEDNVSVLLDEAKNESSFSPSEESDSNPENMSATKKDVSDSPSSSSANDGRTSYATILKTGKPVVETQSVVRPAAKTRGVESHKEMPESSQKEITQYYSAKNVSKPKGKKINSNEIIEVLKPVESPVLNKRPVVKPAVISSQVEKIDKIEKIEKTNNEEKKKAKKAMKQSDEEKEPSKKSAKLQSTISSAQQQQQLQQPETATTTTPEAKKRKQIKMNIKLNKEKETNRAAKSQQLSSASRSNNNNNNSAKLAVEPPQMEKSTNLLSSSKLAILIGSILFALITVFLVLFFKMNENTKNFAALINRQI